MNISKIDYEIAIVGGGICGLATALALHRSREMSVDGKTIHVIPNGKSTDALKEAISLKPLPTDCLPKQSVSVSVLFRLKLINSPLFRFLIYTMGASSVPSAAKEISCLTESGTEQITICHMAQEVVLGCDGVSSIVAKSFGLKPPRISPIIERRGLTTYPKGHGFSNEFIRITEKCLLVGIVPIDDKLVFWFIDRPRLPRDSRVSREPEVLKEAMVEEMKDFPAEITEMVKNSDLDSLSYTQIRYRAPWDLLLARFRIATMTVAGDAMHVMGPFLGQGGSAGLEDAIVLARCLAKEICLDQSSNDRNLRIRFEFGLDNYIKERKTRILMLSTTTYLVGLMLGTSSTAKMLLILAIVRIFFGNPFSHAQYDCGHL
ncbi:monooxygenase 1-like isoform X4 [Tasmannia lanceolata]|uniref:monooxygenase 1-like isoform X4 n=1 Tax=Tasmannia lanceolata TaxID=3420 RepID=UPI00406480A2